MLNFRKIDYSRDLDEIIKLIHKNLDANFTPELFIWKLIENPFGRSYGLVALDKNKIVGLRMFMYWNFSQDSRDTILKAVRPVDTVVDHDYRGKGLFKKLTLSGLEECKEGYEIIFNTPNENSLPGYIKMGWKKIESVDHFKIALVNPFKNSLSFQDIKAGNITRDDKFFKSGMIATQRSQEYFKWRYKNEKYSIAYFSSEEILVAYSVSKWYLIVHEVFGETDIVSFQILNSLAKKKRKSFIYFYNNTSMAKIKPFISLNRTRPVVVLKQENNPLHLGAMDFSLADLESVF